jgi:hypothetical protein
MGDPQYISFQPSTCANSLWRVLTTPGIWHSIIKDKYLSHYTVSSWLLTDTTTTRAVSLFWKNLTKSKDWLTRGLCWQSGSGHSITLGRDRILGLGDATILPPQLIAQLHSKNIWYLYQARDRSISASLPDRWISNDTLELSAELAPLWNTFCSALALVGIHLNELDDQLQWSRGDHSSNLTVQNVYTEITHTLWQLILRAGENNFGAGIFLQRLNFSLGS